MAGSALFVALRLMEEKVQPWALALYCLPGAMLANAS